MNLSEKDRIANDYKEYFMTQLAKEEPISTIYKKKKDKQEIPYDPDEKWKQCYSPNTKARSQLSPHWFLSNKGNLCGVTPKGKVYLIRKQVSQGGYIYHVALIENEQGVIANKKVRLHILMALVWGDDENVYGKKAKQRLAEKGLFAFGNADEELNCHHIDNDLKNNDPSNLRVMTARMHRLIDLKFPNGTNPEKLDEYMQELTYELADEEPYSFVLVESGIHYKKDDGNFAYDTGKRDIRPLRNITFTDVALVQMFEMLAQCRAALGDKF